RYAGSRRVGGDRRAARLDARRHRAGARAARDRARARLTGRGGPLARPVTIAAKRSGKDVLMARRTTVDPERTRAAMAAVRDWLDTLSAQAAGAVEAAEPSVRA